MGVLDVASSSVCLLATLGRVTHSLLCAIITLQLHGHTYEFLHIWIRPLLLCPPNTMAMHSADKRANVSHVNYCPFGTGALPIMGGMSPKVRNTNICVTLGLPCTYELRSMHCIYKLVRQDSGT